MNLLYHDNYSDCGNGSCASTGAIAGVAHININGENGFFHILHEFAHLLGLEDKYDENTGLPYDGYGDNIMGVTGQMGVKPEQIEEIWIPNSKNGSEGNVVYELE